MADAPKYDLNWIVSVDDHVIEPPNVWLDRLPAKYHDECPRMITEDDGQEYWVYEDKKMVTGGLGSTAGRSKEDITVEGYPYSEMRPGCYDPVERLKDMDEAGVLASLNFPSIPRFCGQLFWEARDKDLALLCVKAYNDWMIDEWCATEPGRYIPLTLIPLWDPQEAVKEIERTAAKGSELLLPSRRTSSLWACPPSTTPAGSGTRCSRRLRTAIRCCPSTSGRRRPCTRCPATRRSSPTCRWAASDRPGSC